MSNGLIYDVSRLISRTLNASPNGIDRIDLLLADQFLARSRASALRFGFLGPGLFHSGGLPNPAAKLKVFWRESVPDQDDLFFLRALADHLLGDGGSDGAPVCGSSWRGARRRVIGPLNSFFTYAPRRGEDPARTAPKNALYINASHFPIEWRSHVAWLERRPDVRPVLFIHDLLPVERPELFWASEPRRHQARLQFLARRGAAALVTSGHVEGALGRHLRNAGRSDLPIFRAVPPVAAEFFDRPPADDRLSRARYFVICGTIEPRKNHRLLLDVWRRFARTFGANAPKLVIIGKRGWKCDDIIVEMQDRDLGQSVIVVNGLPTSIYKQVLAHAAALLAPAHAEGLGLPIGEALALGVPVIASDIEGHREYSAPALLLLDPLNIERWEEAIIETARSHSCRHSSYPPASLRTEATYFRELDAFLKGLS